MAGRSETPNIAPPEQTEDKLVGVADRGAE
jgi:hypothetical protein